MDVKEDGFIVWFNSSFAIFIIISILFLTPIQSKAFINPDSLYANADVVLSGRIVNISDAIIGDSGTEFYFVSVEADSIYKQNFHISTNPVNITWVVSNLRCDETPMAKCISQYQTGKRIFFLNREHFYGGEEIPDSLIHLWSETNEELLWKISHNQKIVINHFYNDNLCNDNCELCNNIKVENWKKVERYISKHSNDDKSIPWMQHRRIKWVMTDRVILASLPSYSSSRFNFITDSTEVEVLIGYQVGYYKNYCTWVPHLLYNLLNIQAFKYFSIENVDTLILKSFIINSHASEQYLGFEKDNYTRMLTDISSQDIYGMNMPLPDDYILLASVFDGELQLYEDYKSMPDYIGRAKLYIDQLEVDKKVYLLSLMATHTIPEIGEYSLRALFRLDDARCIPFLISISEYKLDLYNRGWERFELHESYLSTLIKTLDSLTGCQTYPYNNSYGFSGNVFDLSLNIPVWKKKIREFEE